MNLKMKTVSTTSFNGYPVISKHGPLIENILLGNEEVLFQMLNAHKRIAVMRFELNFPDEYHGKTDVISKFFDSLRHKLKNDLARKTENRGRTIHSEVGYVWVRELSGRHGWHYHVALFVNYDVYNCFGLINGKKINMYNRLSSSWASAIGIPLESALGLVHIPDNAIYKLELNCEDIVEDIHSVLYRLSYLAKVKTKPYRIGYGMRFYGTSRR